MTSLRGKSTVAALIPGRRRTDPAAPQPRFSPAIGEVAVLHTVPALSAALAARDETIAEQQQTIATLRGRLETLTGTDIGRTTGDAW